MFKKYILGIVGSLAIGSLSAQQLPILNHYIYNPYLFNPARTGQNDYGSVNVNFKKQWVSLPYSPLTAVLSMEAPLRNTKIGNMGLGGMVYSDQMHIINKMGGLVSYAYHVPIQKNKSYKHQFSAGLSMGVIHQRFNYAAATVADPTDLQVLANNTSGTSFDFSMGLDYQWRDLHVGFSMLQGLNNGLKFIAPGADNIKFINTRHFMVMTSYRHRFKPERKHPVFVEPVVLVRALQAVPAQVEVNALVGLEGIAWLGLGYRSSNIETATSAINVTLGGEVLRKFVFAYTFELGVDGQLNASMGTQHEFMLAYRFNAEGGGGKKVKELEQQIQQIKEDNSLIERRLTETQTTIARQQTVLDSLREELTKQSGNNEQLKQEIQRQEQKVNSLQNAVDEHSKKLDKHDQDIDALRKAIPENPLKYKKIGEVFFQTGSSTLDKTALSNIEATKGFIMGNPDTKVYIYGHASTDGSPKVNQELSAKRAAAVQQQLISLGVPAARIQIIPFGADNPTGGGGTKPSEADRRVDIIITEGKGKL